MYIKKSQEPLHSPQTSSTLALHCDLPIPVAYCFCYLEIPGFSAPNFLWLDSEKLIHYYVFMHRQVFKFLKAFELLLRVKQVVLFII